MMRMGQEDEQSRILCELSALVYNMLRSPMDGGSPHRSLTEITPAGFASLLFGMSLALMVCGSVTFVIGFMLMPWVIGLVMVLYVAGVLSSVSSFLSWLSGPRKDLPLPAKNALTFSYYFNTTTAYNPNLSGNFGEEINME